MITPSGAAINYGAGIELARRGVKHHFVSPKVEVNTALWIMFAGATAFLGLRLWCKMNRQCGLWWDDHILLVSWLVVLTTNIFITVEFETGYVTKSWNDRMLILVTISSCLITIGQVLSKTAFAVTLLRLSEGWQRTVLWWIIGSLNVYLVVLLFINWTNWCDEKQYWWRMPTCAPYKTVFYIKIGQNIYNIVLDFVLSIFPWCVIWKLNSSRLEKIGLGLSMSLGIVIAVTTCLRTIYMLDRNLNKYDDLYFWRQGMTEIWLESETIGTIIVQTLPVIRIVFQDLSVTLGTMELNETTRQAEAGGTKATMTSRSSQLCRSSSAATKSQGVPRSECNDVDLEGGLGRRYHTRDVSVGRSHQGGSGGVQHIAMLIAPQAMLSTITEATQDKDRAQRDTMSMFNFGIEDEYYVGKAI